jgi:hypothetical protein
VPKYDTFGNSLTMENTSIAKTKGRGVINIICTETCIPSKYLNVLIILKSAWIDQNPPGSTG